MEFYCLSSPQALPITDRTVSNQIEPLRHMPNALRTLGAESTSADIYDNKFGQRFHSDTGPKHTSDTPQTLIYCD